MGNTALARPSSGTDSEAATESLSAFYSVWHVAATAFASPKTIVLASGAPGVLDRQDQMAGLCSRFLSTKLCPSPADPSTLGVTSPTCSARLAPARTHTRRHEKIGKVLMTDSIEVIEGEVHGASTFDASHGYHQNRRTSRGPA